MLNIDYLNSVDADFKAQFMQLAQLNVLEEASLVAQVQDIIKQVVLRGDAAVVEFTNKFDQRNLSSAVQLEIPLSEARQAYDNIEHESKQALEQAKERILDYHLKQKQASWHYSDVDNNILGQQVTPIDKVGIYVPGGKASYPSSVLMNAIPATIAGVQEIIMTVPAPGGVLNPLVLASAYLAGVTRIFTLGGAQAIAALAYGTDTVPKVNKIVGPGNAYVATAKRLVFGKVGIDMLAGPSEVVIISDGSVAPKWLAADLMAQAEHDPQARAILISTSKADIDAVNAAIVDLLPQLERSKIILEALSNKGVFIQVESLEQAIELTNQLAPEHLELAFTNASDYVSQIKHAGAIFVGGYSCESLGDYCAGPNHTLPTSGTAAFASPLGVYDFQKRSSIINMSASGSKKLAGTAAILADGEGLGAHALAAKLRMT